MKESENIINNTCGDIVILNNDKQPKYLEYAWSNFPKKLLLCSQHNKIIRNLKKILTF
jgi:hypothetical protein